MELEPDVMARIARRKGRAGAGRAVVAVVPVALCALIVVFIIVPYAAGNTTFSPLVRETAGAGRVLVLVFVALGLDLVFAILYVPGLLRDRAYYARLTARAKRYDLSRLSVFMNALDGARLKAGVDEPPIAVLDGVAPNALTFEGHGKKPVVGVTHGLLGADLSYAQAEGVMAHQLVGILTGDYLRRPGSFGFETLTYVILGVYSILALAGAPIVSAGRGTLAGVMFLVAAAGILLLGGYLSKKLRGGEGYDYILADSIAASVTGRPEELAEAIRKLDSIVNGNTRSSFPDNELGTRYLFAPPYRWSETAAGFVRRRHGELDMHLSERMLERQVEGVQKSMDDLADWASELLTERLENLQAP